MERRQHLIDSWLVVVGLVGIARDWQAAVDGGRLVVALAAEPAVELVVVVLAVELAVGLVVVATIAVVVAVVASSLAAAEPRNNKTTLIYVMHTIFKLFNRSCA